MIASIYDSQQQQSSPQPNPSGVRSPGLSNLVDQVIRFMRQYEKSPATGYAPPPQQVDLLVDGYKWGNKPLSVSLREKIGSTGHYIAVREQVLADAADTSNPQSLGIVSYESFDDKVHAYAIFSMNGNNMFQSTTDNYEPKSLHGNPSVGGHITVQQFLKHVYTTRESLSLVDLRPKVSLTYHLQNFYHRRLFSIPQPANPIPYRLLFVLEGACLK